MRSDKETTAADRAAPKSKAPIFTRSRMWAAAIGLGGMIVGSIVGIGDRNQVFGLLGARSTFADVNLSGTRKRVSVGDAIPVSDDARPCTIFYKQATPRADGRIGFDLSCG